MEATAQFKLGTGVFTLSDVSEILRIDYRRVYDWWKKYWSTTKNTSVQFPKEIRLDFNNLVEFLVLKSLVDAGVRPGKIFTAHDVLAGLLSTNTPFAKKSVLDAIKTDGKQLYFEMKDQILSLDSSGQFNLSIIQAYIDNIEFLDGIADRFWPLGRASSVVIDPKIQFGQPTVSGTRIQSEVLYKMHEAGESPGKIAFMYDLRIEQVKDAITYHEAA